MKTFWVKSQASFNSAKKNKPGFVKNIFISNDKYKSESFDLVKKFKKVNNYKVSELIITGPSFIDSSIFWENAIKE